VIPGTQVLLIVWQMPRDARTIRNSFHFRRSVVPSSLPFNKVGALHCLITLRTRAFVGLPERTGAAPITGAPAACCFDIHHDRASRTARLGDRIHHRYDPVLDWRVAGRGNDSLQTPWKFICKPLIRSAQIIRPDMSPVASPTPPAAGKRRSSSTRETSIRAKILLMPNSTNTTSCMVPADEIRLKPFRNGPARAI